MQFEQIGRGRLPIDPVVLVALIVLPCLFLVPVTHDAIWQVWIGRQLLHGAHLYTDIIEINPPLWFWLAVPLAAVGQAFGISSQNLAVGFFVVAIAISLHLTPRRFRLIALPALTILPLQDFAQREHFALITTVPYCLLIASRMAGERVRAPWAVGLFAALGFALKPYFVIVPLALELLAWRQKRVRPETIALAVVAVTYSAAAFIFTPEYFSQVLPMARRAYGAFIGEFLSPILVVLSLILAAVGAVIGRRKGSPASRALLVAALAFLPAAILQAKGWSYHTLPTRGLLFLAIAVEIVQSRRNPIGDAFLLSAGLLCLLPVGVYQNSFRPEMETHLKGIAPGSSIIVLASNPSTAWPMVEEHHLRWGMSQFCLWQIAAATMDPMLEADLRQIVAKDFAKRPDYVVIDRKPILGLEASSLLPKGWPDGYALRMRSKRFESYERLKNPS